MVSLGGLDSPEELSMCCDGTRDEARGVPSDEYELNLLMEADRGADSDVDRLALLEVCSVLEDAASRLEGSRAACEKLLVCSSAVKGQYVV